MARPSDQALRKALELAKGWQRRPHVMGVAIGQRHRAGVHRPEPCVVVLLDRKLSDAEVAAARRKPFPRTLRVKIAGRTQEVGVDVQEVGESVGRLQGLVGGRVSIGGAPKGAVGAVVVRAQQQRHIMVAGHVARRTGRKLELLPGLDARVSTLHMGRFLDHALATPSRGLVDGEATLCDGRAINGVRVVDSTLVGKQAFLHRADSGEVVATRVRAVEFPARFHFPDRDEPTRMQGLVATDADTVAGDSGTLLFDGQRRAIGTLVGVFGGRSVFVPCDTAFSRLGVRL